MERGGIKNSKSKLGIFMIHGTLGSPHEFQALERALQDKNYMTQAISLPGHGDVPSYSLNQVTAALLMDYCKTSYQAFSNGCESTILLGHSLGGDLCIIIGCKPS